MNQNSADLPTESSQSPNLRYVHSWHYDMLINQERSGFYNSLIKDNCQGKVVLEIGTGSGLMAVLAVRHGASHVYCCEENPLLALAARQLFKRLGVENKITMITKNSNKIATDEIPSVDVVLHELFGSDPFNEEMVPTLRDAKRFMKESAIFLPDKIQIMYQPIRTAQLPEKIYFQDIELIEMSQLLIEVHPALRVRDKNTLLNDVYYLPEVSIQELITKPYSWDEVNPAMKNVDAVEITYRIIHGEHTLQAAAFGSSADRDHWYPLVFYKLDIPSPKLQFAIVNQNKLTVL